MLVKVYRTTPEGERRYAPAKVVSTEVVPVCGQPDPERIWTSRMTRQLRVTKAMQAGITDHAWSVREILEAA